MPYDKFDVSELMKLNDPGRFETLIPEVMWRAVGDPTPEVIIEIGAGTGLFAQRFAQFAPGAVVYAVDTEQAMLDWLRQNRVEATEGRIITVLSTESAVPLADGVADLVSMINLHHELADPVSIYAEAFRLLKPGGRVLVVDWAPRETQRGPSLAVRATPAVLRDLLAETGFDGISVQEDALPWHTLVTANRPVA